MWCWVLAALALPAIRVAALQPSSTAALLLRARRPALYAQQQTQGWDKGAVPSCYAEAAKLLESCVYSGLSSSSPGKMWSVDMLLPGLNPKLEQKAILRTEYLFRLVASLMPILSTQFESTLLAFQSIGDAAGFQKYCFQTNTVIPSSVILGDVSSERVDSSCECVLFITTRNHVGDPVLRTVREIVDKHPKLTSLFLNCDLSDKVTTGIVDRKGRDEFRSGIKPLFHFRNIVTIQRPSLTPIELGAIMYTPSSGWRIYAANQDDIVGPGSLNRFCSQAVFQRDAADPTAANPPGFILAGEYYETRPRREDIDTAINRAEFLASRLAKRQESRESQRQGQAPVATRQEAVAILERWAGGATRETSSATLLDALALYVGSSRSDRFQQVSVPVTTVSAAGVSAPVAATQGVVSLLDDGSSTTAVSAVTSPAAASKESAKAYELDELLLSLCRDGGRFIFAGEVHETDAFEASLSLSGPITNEWAFTSGSSGAGAVAVMSTLRIGPLVVAKYKGQVDYGASARDASGALHLTLERGLLAGGLVQLDGINNSVALDLLLVAPRLLVIAGKGAGGEDRYQLWTRV